MAHHDRYMYTVIVEDFLIVLALLDISDDIYLPDKRLNLVRMSDIYERMHEFII